MRGRRAGLAVAAAAFAGIVIVIAVDSAFGAEPYLEWRDASGAWREIRRADAEYAPGLEAANVVLYRPNATVEFRYRVENDRPLAYDARIAIDFSSFARGDTRRVADGALAAAAFGEATLPFSVASSRLVPESPAPSEPLGPRAGGQFLVTADGTSAIYYAVTFEEVET